MTSNAGSPAQFPLQEKTLQAIVPELCFFEKKFFKAALQAERFVLLSLYSLKDSVSDSKKHENAGIFYHPGLLFLFAYTIIFPGI